MYDSARVRYDMILVLNILTELRLNRKFSEQVIKAYDGPFKWSTTPMVDLGTYIFKYLYKEKITPEQSFTNPFFEELYEAEYVHTDTNDYV